jgi:hypothetical protein
VSWPAIVTRLSTMGTPDMAFALIVPTIPGLSAITSPSKLAPFVMRTVKPTEA